MSFPEEIMDLCAEGAARMTAAINEKKKKEKEKKERETDAVTVSHYGNVRTFLLPVL